MLPVYENEYNTIFIMPEVARSFYTDIKYGQNFFSYSAEELLQICKSVFYISLSIKETSSLITYKLTN